MSTETAEPPVAVDANTGSLFRLFALVGTAALLAAYASVFVEILSDIGEGNPALLLGLVVLSMVAASVLARVVHERVAALLAAGMLVVGGSWYLLSTPWGFGLLTKAGGEVLKDTISLLTGLSILRITNPSDWILGFTPAPVFFAWYLGMRRRYVLGALVGGLALGLVVLTGDASTKVTLAGVLGGIAAVGFGELERRDGSFAQADVLAILFAVMMVLALLVPLVPGGRASPVYLGGGSGGSGTTLEGSLTAAPEQMQIQGSIRLSPEVRFTVYSEERHYWRVAAYDRFTGDSWIRTGSTYKYEDRGEQLLRRPPGSSHILTQRYRIENPTATLAAAGYPLEVEDELAAMTRVTELGTLQPRGTLEEGATYEVTSSIVDTTPAQLRASGTKYPNAIEDRYTDLPDSISARFYERTNLVVQNADTPYDKAKAIERYLEGTKEYSLNVSRPTGNVAEAFLFEMDEGYCVYYATTMVAMLRAEGIPARYVVGYTSGQQVDEDTYVVRGLDSHAWVEAFFPGVGWVKFDPTPAGPRRDAEIGVVEDARDEGEENVDTGESEGEPLTTTPTPTTSVTTVGNTSTGNSTATATNPFLNPDDIRGDDAPNGSYAFPTFSTEPNGSGPGSGPGLPSPTDTVLGLVLAIGVAAGIHRSGAHDRVYQEARLHWQGPRATPDEDVERAYERLEYLLSRRYRARGEEETLRQYLAALTVAGLDDRAERVGDLYEAAHYGDGVTEAEALEAIRLVNRMVTERTPVVGVVARRLG